MPALRFSYIGEPIAAAGFALLGGRIHTPPAEAGAVWPLLVQARKESDLVILHQAHAQTVADRLDALLLAEPAPPVLVLPGMDRDEAPLPEAVARARRELGLSQANH